MEKKEKEIVITENSTIKITMNQLIVIIGVFLSVVGGVTKYVLSKVDEKVDSVIYNIDKKYSDEYTKELHNTSESTLNTVRAISEDILIIKTELNLNKRRNNDSENLNTPERPH